MPDSDLARVRPAGPEDVSVVLGVLDRAVVDMVRTGSAEQWGSQPWSTQPRRVRTVTDLLSDPDKRAWVAETDAAAVAVVVIGPQAPDYVPAVDHPESYVHLLATDRGPSSRGWGRRLLEVAGTAAADTGLTHQRVDCWAGADGSLVRFYVSCGFGVVGDFTVGDWPGAVLERLLGTRSDDG